MTATPDSLTTCGGETHCDPVNGVCALHELSVQRIEERMKEQTQRSLDQDRRISDLSTLITDLGSVVAASAKNHTVLATTVKVVGAVLTFVAGGAFLYTTLVWNNSQDNHHIIETATMEMVQSVSELTVSVDHQQRMIERNQELDDKREEKREQISSDIAELSRTLSGWVKSQETWENRGQKPEESEAPVPEWGTE